MGWFVLPLLLFIPSTSLSSSICKSNDCEKASEFLFSVNNEKEACLDLFAHSCTSEARKKRAIEEDQLEAKLKKEDRRILLEYLERRKDDSDDPIMSGVKKLNESCMSFNQSLFKALYENINEMLNESKSGMSLETVAGFISRGLSIFFRSQFTYDQYGNGPKLSFRNADSSFVYRRSLANLKNKVSEKQSNEEYFARHYQAKRNKLYDLNEKKLPLDKAIRFYHLEEKLFKFKPVDRGFSNFRVYSYDNFVETFSVGNWNMSKFLDGLAPRKSMENISVEDPQGIHYVVSILSEYYKNDILKQYIREAYLIKLPNYHFLKRVPVDFPNPNKTDSTKVDDCLSLVIRFFPFLYGDVKRNTTNPQFFDWVEQATFAVKKTLYKKIDDSDWMEPFDKVFFLDILTKVKVYVYNLEDRDDGALEYEALAKALNSTDLIHNLREIEGSPTNLVARKRIDDSAYTLVHERGVYMQLHDKKAEVYNATIQVAMARIITTIGHEIGHNVAENLLYIASGRSLSDRFLKHLRNTLDCYRRVADAALEDSSLYGHLTEVNNQRVLREVLSDILGVQIGAEAYSNLDIELLPRMKSKEEMFIRATTSSKFYCTTSYFEDIDAFMLSTHPVQSQRIEYHRLFDKTENFGKAFNCTPKEAVCPNIF